ncbi:hypothetical protein D3C78_1703870 [compost metagenome]
MCSAVRWARMRLGKGNPGAEWVKMIIVIILTAGAFSTLSEEGLIRRRAAAGWRWGQCSVAATGSWPRYIRRTSGPMDRPWMRIEASTTI